MVADSGPVTLRQRLAGSTSTIGWRLLSQCKWMRLRSAEVLVVHTLMNHVTCSTTGRVHGSNLGPNRTADGSEGASSAPWGGAGRRKDVPLLVGEAGRCTEGGASPSDGRDKASLDEYSGLAITRGEPLDSGAATFSGG